MAARRSLLVAAIAMSLAVGTLAAGYIGVEETANRIFGDSTRCPRCRGSIAILPRLGGPTTTVGHQQHLAGAAVADGNCVGPRTVSVCRQCKVYRDDFDSKWRRLPPLFGTQPNAADVVEKAEDGE